MILVTSNPSVSVRLKSSLSSFVETPNYLIINFSGKKLQGSELPYDNTFATQLVLLYLKMLSMKNVL